MSGCRVLAGEAGKERGMRFSGVAAVLLCLAVLVACGSDLPRGQAGYGSGPTERPAASETPSGSAPSGSVPSGSASSGPVPSGSVPTGTADLEVVRAAGEPVLVKGVTFSRQQSLDRVVIDLVGVVPGYSVRWVDGLVQDGSGEPIDVKG